MESFQCVTETSQHSRKNKCERISVKALNLVSSWCSAASQWKHKRPDFSGDVSSSLYRGNTHTHQLMFPLQCYGNRELVRRCLHALHLSKLPPERPRSKNTLNLRLPCCQRTSADSFDTSTYKEALNQRAFTALILFNTVNSVHPGTTN